MTAGTQKATAMIRVDHRIYEELVRLQQEFYEETHGRITLSGVVERLLADRKTAQP